MSTKKSRKRKKTGKGNVLVAIRVRPLNRIETRTKQIMAWKWNAQSVEQTWRPKHLENKLKLQKFTYDCCFGKDSTNMEVYDSVVRSIVLQCMNGYNGSVIAYGQTSSGKTYTIHGTKDNPGMIPLAVAEVFEQIEESDRSYILRVAYIECYNEAVNDLLNPQNTNLKIRQKPDKSFFVKNLTEQTVVTPENIFSLISSGESHRHVGRTNYNSVSSRSHTIFRIIIESQSSTGEGPTRISQLNLVDLAGSENVGKVGSAERSQESGYINNSLSLLGQGLRHLGNDPDAKYFSVRNSKLTLLLDTCLSGRSKIGLICAISPSSGNVEESISTLQFASRAKKIDIVPIVNHDDSKEGRLATYKNEIADLKRELAMLKGNHSKKKKKIANQSEIDALEKKHDFETAQFNQHIAQLTKLILRSSRMGTPVGIPTTEAPSVYVPQKGDRVRWNKATATVRWTGVLLGKNDVWIGLELDEPNGKNDGSLEGHRYFTCGKNYGLFVKPKTVIKIADSDSDSDDFPLSPPARFARQPSNYFTLPKNFKVSSYRATDHHDETVCDDPTSLEHLDAPRMKYMELSKQLKSQKRKTTDLKRNVKKLEDVNVRQGKTLNEWDKFHNTFQNKMSKILESLAILQNAKTTSEEEKSALKILMSHAQSVTTTTAQDVVFYDGATATTTTTTPLEITEDAPPLEITEAPSLTIAVLSPTEEIAFPALTNDAIDDPGYQGQDISFIDEEDMSLLDDPLKVAFKRDSSTASVIHEKAPAPP